MTQPPSPQDRIAQLEAELRAMTDERNMYRALANQRVETDAVMHEHARNWVALSRLLNLPLTADGKLLR